jgi:hypothetical protein
MDGRKGCTPVNGCHSFRCARFVMASASRDRVTIDLRGIGPSVRAAASAGRLRVATLRGSRSLKPRIIRLRRYRQPLRSNEQTPS